MDAYQEQVNLHQKRVIALNFQHKLFAFLRMLLLTGAMYLLYRGFHDFSIVYASCFLLCLVGFLMALKIHQKISWNRSFSKTILKINEDELQFLRGEVVPWEDGIAFAKAEHPYANDLDFFGPNSMFQYLNRAGTYWGMRCLADEMSQISSAQDIIEKQRSIREVQAKLAWRQKIFALGILSKDSQETKKVLWAWLDKDVKQQSFALKIAYFVSPTILCSLIVLYCFTPIEILGKSALILFLFNLLLLILRVKNINQELNKADEINGILYKYSLIFSSVEQELFTTSHLLDLQNHLNVNGCTSSKEIRKLAKLFSSMESLHNPIGAILFNGLFLYHLHTFEALNRWKRDKRASIKKSLMVMGQIEALNSLANFSYNNPSFVFPSLNDNFLFSFSDLGHPLISSQKRVGNHVVFDQQKLIILSGSNMSGKSTFLRSVGVNMVLGGIGAPVCASSANMHPMQVWVSMRLSDSLSEKTSYFFAEVKRLKMIMEALEKEVCFVLLDEILRGTNSEDKCQGTKAVIHRIKSNKGIGIIATHDLEVCEMEREFPNEIANCCFESEIISNEIHFDYQLRKGICRNKSATFLLKKEGVI